ncbi:MAG: D-alanyl-D-alanine carboxypeptidase [Clostridia bacterium]|nr:D-alanyl-D-alanine carboxypeptidase [Clostridia bacterium]
MKKVTALLLAFLFVFPQWTISAKSASKAPEIESDAVVLMDAETGQILFQKNGSKKAYPASITKVLTVYLAAENCKPDEKMVASQSAIDAVPKDSTYIAIDYGEELTVEQAANAAILMSANDASNVLGEHVSGSLDAFLELMNDTAKSFGAKNSHFTNTNGLPEDKHYTTAVDFANITRNCLKNDEFKKYFGNKNYTIGPTNKKSEPRNFTAKHRMMYMDKYKHLGAKGGKTGYTTQAGHTSVTYAERDGKSFVVVALGSSSIGQNLRDIEALLTYGYEKVPETIITAKEIGSKTKGNITYMPKGKVRVYLPNGLTKDKLTYQFNKKQVSVLDPDGNTVGALEVEAKYNPSAEKNYSSTFFTIVLWLAGIWIVWKLWRRNKKKRNRRKRRMKRLHEQMQEEK